MMLRLGYLFFVITVNIIEGIFRLHGDLSHLFIIFVVIFFTSKIMKNEKDSYIYETPQMRVIEFMLDSAILTMSNVENPIEGEESDW